MIDVGLFDRFWPRRRLQSATDDTDLESEKESMRRDLEQTKRLNEYLLNKAIARGFITAEVAAAIRAQQAYRQENLDIGSD